MTGLVDYSDSDAGGEESEREEGAPSSISAHKKRKLSNDGATELPPLPSSFLDQYSSTVRTSTRDDPTLHGGRKRVTPHVEGHWPSHVYLEWHPERAESEQLNNLLASLEQPNTKPEYKLEGRKQEIHSLLQNELGVPLPLHISLSRPLTLRTAQKDSFVKRMTQSVKDNGIQSFNTRPKELAWHPNESGTRWFLVLRLWGSTTPELGKLLGVSNTVAQDFEQPTLYSEGSNDQVPTQNVERFHISLAWSLSSPGSTAASPSGSGSGFTPDPGPFTLPTAPEKLDTLSLRFPEVKVRIGQDVHTIPLKARRQSSSSAK